MQRELLEHDILTGTRADGTAPSPLDPDLWPTILRPEERVAMTGLEAKRVFCAKEASPVFPKSEPSAAMLAVGDAEMWDRMIHAAIEDETIPD